MVLLIDGEGQLCEVVTVLALSSDLVGSEAVGRHISEVITSGGMPPKNEGGDNSGVGPAEERPVEMRVHVTDAEGRVRECRCSLVSLPSVEGIGGWRLAALSDLSSHSSRENALSHRALHDHLTGLINRAALLDRLEHSMLRVDRTSAPVVVVFIDLDEFKPINDRFGHEVGDQILAHIGARIAAVAGRSDTVARLGGDEFAILIDHSEPSGSEDRVGRGIDVAQRVLEAISQPVTVAGVSAIVSASIGVAVAGPESSTSSLLHDADLAMYTAKRSGPGQIRIFDPSMRQRAARYVEYRRELPFAIVRNQLSVVYLPQLDLVTGAVEGWEALVRWEHPDLGAVEPDEFVPIAERAGVMGEIGAWVRRQAIRDYRLQITGVGEKKNNGAQPRFLSFNLSLSELADTHTARSLLADLREGDLDPSVVIIEISEQVFDLGNSVMMSVVAELRSAGIRIALDDVGAASSSFRLLHDAPVEIVKLAPMVVAEADRGEAGVVAAYLAMCGRRGLWVVAEGVETHEQHSALIALGCRSGQGRWLAAPQGRSESGV